MSTIASTSTSHSNFASIFNTALDTYQRKTKIDLASHPLLPRLQSCDSPEAILTLLREQTSAFSQSQNGDRLTKWLTPTVNVLYSFAAAIDEGVGLAFPPANIIFAGIGALLAAANNVISSQDKLIDLFNLIERYFHRLEIYTTLTPTKAMKDIIVEIMVEVLTILALATNDVKRGGLKRYVKKLTGNTDIEDCLETLDKLTRDEARMASAELLKVTHSAGNRGGGVHSSTERDLLHTNGYIARMLGTMQVSPYFGHLLRFNERDFHLVVSNGSFLLLYPSVQNVHPIAYIGNRPAWLLDYILRDIGTVVPQHRWSPTTPSDSRRYGATPLNMPIFFVQRDGTTLGISLNQAASGSCSVLLNARRPAPVGTVHTTFIRVTWPGYNEWSTQIMTRDQTPAHSTISIESLAARIARAVCRFLQDCAGQRCTSPDWFVGQGGITANDIVLVGIIQVTQGSWQPILQLNRYVLPQSSNTRSMR